MKMHLKKLLVAFIAVLFLCGGSFALTGAAWAGPPDWAGGPPWQEENDKGPDWKQDDSEKDKQKDSKWEDGEHPSLKGLQNALRNVERNNASERAQNVLRNKIEARGGQVDAAAVKIKVVERDELRVSFDNVELGELDLSEQNFVLQDSEGDTLEDNEVTGVDRDGNTYTLTLDDELENGDYILLVDFDDEDMDNLTGEFTVDYLVLYFEDFEARLYDAGEEEQTIIVDFGEEMAVEEDYSVTDPDKYAIKYETSDEETETVELNEIDGVEINAIAENSGVEITIPGDEYELNPGENDYVLVVQEVADAEGNTTGGEVEIDITVAGEEEYVEMGR